MPANTPIYGRILMTNGEAPRLGRVLFVPSGIAKYGTVFVSSAIGFSVSSAGYFSGEIVPGEVTIPPISYSVVLMHQGDARNPGAIQAVSMGAISIPAQATTLNFNTALQVDARTATMPELTTTEYELLLDALSVHEAAINNPHGVTKTQVGLSAVDNTSDADKPISVAAQAALDLKANLDIVNPIQDRINAILAARAALPAVPFLNFDYDDLFTAIDIAGGAGQSFGEIFNDVKIPANGFISAIRLTHGGGTGQVTIRLYDMNVNGTHTLASTHVIETGAVVGDRVYTLAPEDYIPVKHNQRVSHQTPSLRSSYATNRPDRSGGALVVSGTFDPLTEVWIDKTSDTVLAYGIGLELKLEVESIASYMTSRRPAPTVIAALRSGQSNDEYTLEAPLDTLLADTYRADSARFANQAGFFNGNPLTLPGSSAGFIDMARKISRERFGFEPSYGDCDGAKSGVKLELLMRGNADYTRGVELLTKHSGMYGGLQTQIPLFAQGESDQSFTSRADWTKLLIEYATQIAEDSPSKRDCLPLLAVQTHTKFLGSPTTGYEYVLPIAGAHLDAMQHSRVTCVGPTYGHIALGGMADGNQAVHYSQRTNRLIGAVQAWVAYELMSGRDYMPVYITGMEVFGNDIILTSNRRDLVLDTVSLPAQTNYGFGVRDIAGTLQTLTSVTLESGGRIRLSLTSPPQVGYLVQIGTQIASTTGTPMVPYSGAATNVRSAYKIGDTPASVLHPSDPIYEWLCADEIKL